MDTLNILVVDDDRDVAEGLAEILEMEDHEVTLAYTGEEAVEKFSRRDFDIVFTDVMMPGMNGVEAFFEMRKIKPDAKVFMMTGFSLQQLLDEAKANGVMGVFDKPVDVVEVLEALENVDFSAQGGLILVADDDPEYSAAVQELLTENGFNVAVASDGIEAVEKVRGGGVDILLLDLNLPGLDGLEVYTKLRESGCAVPTIVVTGHSAEQGSAIQTLRDMSVSSVMTKPVEPPELIKELQRRSTER